MALNSTQSKTLKSLALNDLILPQTALENIVENNELKDLLSNEYVSISSYNSLRQRVESIELIGISSYAEDKDSLCASCQQLCGLVSTLSGEVSQLRSNIQELCTLVQTTIQHNTMSFSNVNASAKTESVSETTSNAAVAVQLMAAMPERNEFAVAEDQLPAEEPAESQIEKQPENSITITTSTSKPRKKKNR